MFGTEFFPDGTTMTMDSDANWNNECRFPHQLSFDEQIKLRVPGCLWRRYEKVPVAASAMPGKHKDPAGTPAAKINCRLCMKEDYSFQCWLCTKEQCNKCEGGEFLQKTSMRLQCFGQEDTEIHRFQSVSYTHLTLPTKRIV